MALLSNSISNLFGASPIKPIQRHMTKAHECVVTLGDFLAATVAGDWERAQAMQAQVAKLENDADALKMSIRMHLPKSLFMPVPREDLLELLHVQERLANGARDIAGIMLGRRMCLPPNLAQPVQELLAACTATSAQALKAIQELDELLETGFSGPEVDFVETLIRELNDLEHQTDVLQVGIRSQLFAREQDLPPVDVIFFYKIIDRIGDLANAAQQVGSRLQILIAR